MKIVEVRSKSQMKDFVRLPWKLHGKDPCYAPPMWADEKKAYYAKDNPILRNSDFTLLMALDEDGDPVGRTIAYIDHTFNRYYKSKTGFFGAFDCADNDEAGRLLAGAAEEWLRAKGMETVRGPIHPAAENWGFVLEGFERPPVFMSPWNPPYYHRFFIGLGYEKVKDLLVYEADIGRGYSIPERFDRLYEKFFERYPSISIRPIDTRNMEKDARAIWEISNTAYAGNWGYVPLELSVMEDMLKKLKLIVDPDAVWMVEDGGKPVGYCLGFPDINVILKRTKGKLLPLGWARLLLGVKKLKDYRLFGLAVHPDWQKNALDSLMYINLFRHLAPKNIRLEANYILEDNLDIKNALEKLGLEHIKTYRIYEKKLAS